MPRTMPVSQVMTTEVLTFAPDQDIQDAMKRLVEWDVDAGPVVEESGAVVGMLSTTDLIVQQSTLHLPTVITLLGATIEWASSKKHFDRDVEKALGSTVGEVMNDDPITCAPDDTIERAASLLHEHNLSRLPVVADGALVGIIARGDILRAIVEAD
jgi:CBS domain-containing protein